MKANEFANPKPVDKTKIAKSTVSPPAEIKHPAVINEAKKLKFKKTKPAASNSAADTNSEYVFPGISVAPGSELHRIRTNNPVLWARIKNWD